MEIGSHIACHPGDSFACLERDGRLIAYLYGYIYKNNYYAYNTAFSKQDGRFSPGKLIMNEAMCHCMNCHIESFEQRPRRDAAVTPVRWYGLH